MKGWIKNGIRIVAMGLCGVLLGCLVFLPKSSAFYVPDEVKDSKWASILTLWHVETFEGGSTSRATYLERASQALEKRERNLFVHVRTMDTETLNNQLSQGIYPDIISFGHGLGNTLKPFLQPILSDYGVKPEYNAGVALGYLVGGYALIGDGEILKQYEEQPLTSLISQQIKWKNKHLPTLSVGSTPYINPLSSLAALGLEAAPEITDTQYNAYEGFILRKSAMLLGTVRDINRILHRESLGKGRAMRMEFLSHTDLVQYIGITCEGKRREAAELYLAQLFSTAQTQTISTTGMMGTNGERTYHTGYLSEMDTALLSQDLTVSRVFSQ